MLDLFAVTVSFTREKRYYRINLKTQSMTFDLYARSSKQFDQWKTYFEKHCLMRNFDEVYEIQKLLGKGYFGVVRRTSSSLAVLKF